MNGFIRLLTVAVTVLAVAGCKPEEKKVEPDPTLAPPAPRMRRLLDRHYRNAVRDLFGPGAAALANPAPDISSLGFESIGATQIALGPSQVYQYEASARAIAQVTVASPSALTSYRTCSPSGPSDADCHREILGHIGRRAFRRALTTEELDTWVGVAQSASAAYSSFDTGLEYAIAGFLQSPNFLYVIESGATDPKNVKRRKLTGYEMASRLSFFLNDTIPDEALLVAAETSALDDAEEIRTTARELLARPAARLAFQEFYRERFKLRGLTGIQKDAVVFPQWSEALGAAMETEALMLVDEIVWERNTDYHELFDSPSAWVNADLAALYGVSPPASGFAKRQLPPEQKRSGILTQGATLAMLAHPTSTSPTRRGRFFAERLFCRDILPPPPGVDTTLPPDPGTPETMRMKMERHQTDPSCAGCHAYMDGIGFGLEHFDGVGEWRELDNGLPIDDDGNVVDVGTFDGATGLAALIRETPGVDRCWVRNTFRHATGHHENFDEDLELGEIDAAFATSGYKVQDLLVELVASDAFRYTGRRSGFGGGK